MESNNQLKRKFEGDEATEAGPSTAPAEVKTLANLTWRDLEGMGKNKQKKMMHKLALNQGASEEAARAIGQQRLVELGLQKHQEEVEAQKLEKEARGPQPERKPVRPKGKKLTGGQRKELKRRRQLWEEQQERMKALVDAPLLEGLEDYAAPSEEQVEKQERGHGEEAEQEHEQGHGGEDVQEDDEAPLPPPFDLLERTPLPLPAQVPGTPPTAQTTDLSHTGPVNIAGTSRVAESVYGGSPPPAIAPAGQPQDTLRDVPEDGPSRVARGQLRPTRGAVVRGPSRGALAFRPSGRYAAESDALDDTSFAQRVKRACCGALGFLNPFVRISLAYHQVAIDALYAPTSPDGINFPPDASNLSRCMPMELFKNQGTKKRAAALVIFKWCSDGTDCERDPKLTAQYSYKGAKHGIAIPAYTASRIGLGLLQKTLTWQEWQESVGKVGKDGSHLCNQGGCCRGDHQVLEDHDTNLTREICKALPANKRQCEVSEHNPRCFSEMYTGDYQSNLGLFELLLEPDPFYRDRCPFPRCDFKFAYAAPAMMGHFHRSHNRPLKEHEKLANPNPHCDVDSMPWLVRLQNLGRPYIAIPRMLCMHGIQDSEIPEEFYCCTGGKLNKEFNHCLIVCLGKGNHKRAGAKGMVSVPAYTGKGKQRAIEPVEQPEDEASEEEIVRDNMDNDEWDFVADPGPIQEGEADENEEEDAVAGAD